MIRHPRRRRSTSAQLTEIGIRPSRLTLQDCIREATLSVTRAPLRSVLTSLGTVLAVATAIATIGLSDSARGAVSGTFNVLRATLVTFTDSAPQDQGQVLTESSAARLARLRGVRSAGLLWDLNAGQPFPVRRTEAPDPTGQSTIDLPVTVATPAGLGTMGAVVSNGRLYDVGIEHRHSLVALLGAAAARQMGISDVDLSPTIYIGNTQLTVIGIVGNATADSEALLGVIVPPAAAPDLAPAGDTREIIVRTAPGAARLIGAQGPYVLDPFDPARITASVPTDPTLLRNEVSKSVTSLLLAVAVVALTVGIIAITNTTLLSVIQRRAEIGLRRSVGAAPRHIAALVFSESALIGTVGGILGTSTGILIIAGVSASKGWAPVLDPRIAIAAPVIGTLAGLVAGAYPAWRASRVTPISALQR